MSIGSNEAATGSRRVDDPLQSDRSAVVTGAAAGIGRAIAEALCEAGYLVVAVDLDQSGLSTLVGQVGTAVTSLRGDVSDPSTHQEAASLASERAPLTAWVNNAAVDVQGSIHLTSHSDLDRAMKINFGGVFWGMAAAVAAMLRTGHGSIINISSEQASFGYPGYAAYAAAKGAVVALTRQVASEFAHAGVRSNAISPGVIDTPMQESVIQAADDPQLERRVRLAQVPLGRFGTVADVAATAAFLASDASQFVTGQVLVVDGGHAVRP